MITAGDVGPSAKVDLGGSLDAVLAVAEEEVLTLEEGVLTTLTVQAPNVVREALTLAVGAVPTNLFPT